MENQNVCLISRYDERESEVVIIGITDCRFRADRLVENDMEIRKAEISSYLNVQYDVIAWEVRQQQDQTLVLHKDLGLVLTYTFTEIPVNELIDLPEF